MKIIKKMAIGIKIVQRKKVLNNEEYPIFLRIIKNRITKYISLGLSCKLDRWNSEQSEFRRNAINYKKRNVILLEYKTRALKIIDNHSEQGKDLTLKEFD